VGQTRRFKLITQVHQVKSRRGFIASRLHGGGCETHDSLPVHSNVYVNVIAEFLIVDS
jgi:hypothetical protein